MPSYISKSSQGIISERQGRPIIILDYIVKSARAALQSRKLTVPCFIRSHSLTVKSIKDKTRHKKLTVAWEYAA